MAKRKFLILVFLIAPLFLPGRVLAARFLLLPSTKNISSGDHFSVTVAIDTGGTSINAAEGTLSYTARFLRVDSISTAGSVFTFWSQDPIFSNAAANIDFGGGLPSPGVNGSNAKVLTINFTALGIGNGTLNFQDGAILANDGAGTNVLTDSDTGNYQIGGTSASQPNQPQNQNPAVPQSENPLLPQVVSRTHPDENTWYNLNTFEASWNIPTGVDGVSYVLVNTSNYSASPSNKGLVNSTTYDLTKFADGTWYFYVQFHTSSGWGPRAMRKVKIDLTPPGAFSVLRTDTDDPTNPRPSFSWSAQDSASGVAKYSVKIGDGDWFDAQNIAVPGGDFLLPVQMPGVRNITVRAYDYAGNTTDSTASFVVQPIAGPVILNYPKTYSSNDRRFVVTGEALSGQKIILTLSNGSQNITFGTAIPGQGDVQTKTDWSAEYDQQVPSGDWKLTAISQDSRGAESNPTDPLDVQVSGILSEFGPFILEYGVLIALIIIVLGILSALGYFVYHSLLVWRIRMRRDLRRLQEELQDDLKDLDKELGSFPRSKRNRIQSKINKLEEDLNG